MWKFEPTANLRDFERVAGLKDAWSEYIDERYKIHLTGQPSDGVHSALEELRAWGRSASDLRVYNPAAMPMPASQPKNVTWSALPTSFDERFNSTTEKLTFLDRRQLFPGSNLVTRIQDEYCEWVVERHPSGKITKVIFTSEPPEYYDFLFYHSEESRRLLVELYREITGVGTIRLDDLVNSNGEYDWWNDFNNRHAVHMQQPNNTLGAQINIVSRSCILRRNRLGQPITDALGLIRCGGYGDEARQSDPSIGHGVNSFARENRFITIENPVGLYMANVDWQGWTTPDGTDPKAFWKVERGIEDADPNKSYIVRATYTVPPAKGYTVTDVRIGGAPIEFGGQIAARINVRVAVMVSEPQNIPMPGSIGCLGTPPSPAAGLLISPMSLQPRTSVLIDREMLINTRGGR